MTLSNVNQVTSTLAIQMHWGKNTAIYESVLQSMTNLGLAVGVLTGAWFIRYGRRKTLLITSAISIVILVPTLFEVYWLMVLCKFIWGFNNGVGGLIVARLMEEVFPPKIMKKFGAVINLSYAFGATVSILLGLSLPLSKDTEALKTTPYWRLVFGFPILLNAIQLVTFIFIFKYDSPKYYVLTD